MPIGTEFKLYGVAIDARGRIRLGCDHRVKTEDGSRVIRRETLADSWPNTRAGQRAAMDRTLELNIAERDRTLGASV